MTTTNPATTQHHTTTSSYHNPHTGETTWGWECSCGQSTNGINEQLARELAYTHEQHMLPCTCGNPTISVRPNRHGITSQVAATISCDCGYRYVATFHCHNNEYKFTKTTAYTSAIHHYTNHKCRTKAGHDHRHPQAVTIQVVTP